VSPYNAAARGLAALRPPGRRGRRDIAVRGLAVPWVYRLPASQLSPGPHGLCVGVAQRWSHVTSNEQGLATRDPGCSLPGRGRSGRHRERRLRVDPDRRRARMGGVPRGPERYCRHAGRPSPRITSFPWMAVAWEEVTEGEALQAREDPGAGTSAPWTVRSRLSAVTAPAAPRWTGELRRTRRRGEDRRAHR
jgi:hypothetical protein